MLKITITDTGTEEKWLLQGRLVWPWVNELRVNWAKAQRAAEGRTCTAADAIGARAMLVHAIDEDAVAFYREFG